MDYTLLCDGVMKLELIILDGSERRFPLPEGTEITVGASSRCTIRLDSSDVSRSHALLTVRKGRLALLDLGSTNGTFVNGAAIKDCSLEVGDCVRFSSVLAQVVPASDGSSDPGCATGPTAVTVSSSGSVASSLSASQPIAVILQESLVWLLRRWCLAEGPALTSLAEWVLSHRGHRGVALLEPAAEDLVVLIAHGEIQDLLRRPSRLARLRLSAPPGPDGVESLTLDADPGQVVAIRAAGTPWLLLRVGIGMPDSLEIELYARLMAVAQRLDRPGASEDR
jgi:hypothetical protein